MKKFLSFRQRKKLLSELRTEHHRRFADRIRVILLLDNGKSYGEIAQFLFLHEDTARNYYHRYQSGGFEKLVNDDYVGRSSYLTEEEKKS